MALIKRCLEVLQPHLRERRILTLGYPDLVVEAAWLSERFGIGPLPLHPTTGHPDTAAFFTALGSSFEAVDVKRLRGYEREVDLNHPAELGPADLVIDAGTIEHCFNIAQAIINGASAVAPGGLIFHTPPMSMVNHGFYNLNPTLFADFYQQNGWTVELLEGRAKKGFGDPFTIHPTGRFAAPSEAVLYCLARRQDLPTTLQFPTQTKYLSMLKGG